MAYIEKMPGHFALIPSLTAIGVMLLLANPAPAATPNVSSGTETTGQLAGTAAVVIAKPPYSGAVAATSYSIPTRGCASGAVVVLPFAHPSTGKVGFGVSATAMGRSGFGCTGIAWAYSGFLGPSFSVNASKWYGVKVQWRLGWSWAVTNVSKIAVILDGSLYDNTTARWLGGPGVIVLSGATTSVGSSSNSSTNQSFTWIHGYNLTAGDTYLFFASVYGSVRAVSHCANRNCTSWYPSTGTIRVGTFGITARVLSMVVK